MKARLAFALSLLAAAPVGSGAWAAEMVNPRCAFVYGQPAPPQGELIEAPPKIAPGDVVLTPAPGQEGKISQPVGHVFPAGVVPFDDVGSTMTTWIMTRSGDAIGMGYEAVGKPVWRHRPGAAQCWDEPPPPEVLGVGPAGYVFASSWPTTGGFYTLWNRPDGAESRLVAIRWRPATKEATPSLIATLPVKARGLTIRPGLHSNDFDFFMTAAKPGDDRVYLLWMSHTPTPLY